MSQTAAEHLNRIVQLVADVSRDPEAGDRGVAIDDLAARLGTTPAQVRQDLRTLTAISDEASAEWLQSLSVWQEGDRVAAVSRGPYRRPLRFTPDELVAIRVGLALEGNDGEALVKQLNDALALGANERGVQLAITAEGEGDVVALAREAIDRSATLSIKYAGERDQLGSERSIEPHQLVSFEGHGYIVAWCGRETGWRHFRADRVLDALIEKGTFARRADFVPVNTVADVFRSDASGEDVTVRYGAAVARWLGERFPDAKRLDDGGLEVTYRVVEPAWLVRMVLQYGPEAEVIEPVAYRQLMARALA